jgi:cobalt-zinc-cadmium efflux system membrane fusion protein
MKQNAAGLLLAAAVLCGCSSKASDPAAAPAKPAAAEGPRMVELGAEAMREAGISVVTIETRRLPVMVRANGRLTVNENATWRVGAALEGRVTAVLVNVGDHVSKGQELAKLHSPEVQESRANYRRASSAVERLKTGVVFATRQRDRVRSLHENKAASQRQLEEAENDLKTAQAQLAAEQIELERTRKRLSDYLQVSPDGTDELISVRAPGSGTVLERKVTPGTVVSAGGEMFTLADMGTVWAVAAVPESALKSVRPGQLAHVMVQAYEGQRFAGRVTQIGEKLDAETRTVPVRIEVGNRDGRLKPEMYASVELEAGQSEEALFIPRTAVQDVNGAATVFVERSGGHFEPRDVELGDTLDKLVRVTRGLKAGARVAATGGFILKSQLLKSSMNEE